MNEMIERVAKAMHRDHWRELSDEEYSVIPTAPSAFAEWRRQAEIALRSMREPTEWMVARGIQAHDDTPIGPVEPGYVAAWQAMIDAALNAPVADGGTG